MWQRCLKIKNSTSVDNTIKWENLLCLAQCWRVPSRTKQLFTARPVDNFDLVVSKFFEQLCKCSDFNCNGKKDG